MTKIQSKYKRKRLFVDTKVQGSLVRQLIIHWSLACFLIFLYLFTLEAFSNGFSVSFQANLVALWQEYGLLALVLLVISPVFIYDAVKLSNRFVGPMISFRSALNKLATGQDPDLINFRQDDFWKELTKDFNSISAELKKLRGETSDSELNNAKASEASDSSPELAETN